MSVFGQGAKKDFSGDSSAKRRIPWRLWLAVLAMHALALAGLNAVLTLNRLAAQTEQSFDVAILPSDAAKSNPAPKPKLQTPKAEPESAKPADEPAKADVPPEPAALAQPAVPAAAALPEPEATPAAAATTATAPLPSNQAVQGLKALTPAPVLLRYILTKGNDSARASLNWQPAKRTETNTEKPYDLVYEATYFGISIVKQTSQGVLGEAGLLPTRFGDKRRGKSEQAAHFEREKSLITFSNNRPEAKLAMGSQDRASFLIQLASLYAGQPELFKTGQVIELPVASIDELEVWSFEIQASEAMHLPIGQLEAIKLLRRPRRAFDQTIEVWLAPKHDYLPVRIRYTDSTGASDSQLASKE